MLWPDTQILSVAVMFLSGAAVALFYDLCRVAAGTDPRGGGQRGRSGRPARPAHGLWDIVFWVIVTPVVFAATLVSNRGELRLHVLLGLAAGAAAYLVLARPVVVRAGLAVRRGAARVAAAGRRLALRPVRFLGGRLRRAGAGFTAAGRRLAGRWQEGRRRAARRLRRIVSLILAGFRRRSGE